MDVVEITPLQFNTALGCLHEQDNKRPAQDWLMLPLLLPRLMAERYGTVRDTLEKHCPSQHNDSLGCLVRVISRLLWKKTPISPCICPKDTCCFSPFSHQFDIQWAEKWRKSLPPYYHQGIKLSHQPAIQATSPLPSCTLKYLSYSKTQFSFGRKHNKDVYLKKKKKIMPNFQKSKVAGCSQYFMKGG